MTPNENGLTRGYFTIHPIYNDWVGARACRRVVVLSCFFWVRLHGLKKTDEEMSKNQPVDFFLRRLGFATVWCLKKVNTYSAKWCFNMGQSRERHDKTKPAIISFRVDWIGVEQMSSVDTVHLICESFLWGMIQFTNWIPYGLVNYHSNTTWIIWKWVHFQQGGAPTIYKWGYNSYK